MIDLNRAGVVLMEIVSKPDMRSPEEAGAYVGNCAPSCVISGPATATWKKVPCGPTSTCLCAQSWRDDLRTRVEVKNVNSVRFVMQAIEVEAERQVEVWEDGGEVVQETRLFDPSRGETRSMRSKEFAHDYRYFPDPDLLPVPLGRRFHRAHPATLPELPDEKKQRFISMIWGCRPMTPACWSPTGNRSLFRRSGQGP